MLRGGSPELFTELKFKANHSHNVENFAYLQGSSEATHLTNISDESEFEITRSCLTSVGIDHQMQLDIFNLLVAILFLGNVAFDEDSEGYVCGVHGPGQDSFRTASNLLGLDEGNLLSVISKRNMHVNGSIIVKPQSLAQVIFLIIVIVIDNDNYNNFVCVQF